MYLEHFGLREPPFSITPDPRFVFLSERHRDALAHLLFGVDKGGGGGFVQLTGEVGTGKTTLSRLLLEQLPGNTRAALVLNPRVSPVELLETVCEELRLPLEGRRGSAKALVDALNAYLLDAYAQGLRVVLIVDEAQNLSTEALEQVRLLTNLETDTQKLLQILLLGQPELRDMLARPELRQLAQRITARYHLLPLDAAETAAYLRHRYRVAGGLHLPFTARAVQRIHHHAGGVPRLVNVIAERALLGAYAQDVTSIDERLVERAARETLAPTHRTVAWKARSWKGPALAALALGVIAAGATAWALRSRSAAEATTIVAATTTTRPATQPVSAIEVKQLDAAAFAAALAKPGDALAGWQHLLALWRLPATPQTAAEAARCPSDFAGDAHCLRGRGGLDKLVAQGRPALLRLRGADSDAWVPLLGADALRVRLWLDGRTVDVERIALDRVWRGEYALLWRAPVSPTSALADGSRGAGVDWVHARLAPRYLDAGTAAVVDAPLREAVRRFQLDRGLASDGVIGPETLMALAGNDDGPRLRTVLE